MRQYVTRKFFLAAGAASVFAAAAPATAQTPAAESSGGAGEDADLASLATIRIDSPVHGDEIRLQWAWGGGTDSGYHEEGRLLCPTPCMLRLPQANYRFTINDNHEFDIEAGSVPQAWLVTDGILSMRNTGLALLIVGGAQLVVTLALHLVLWLPGQLWMAGSDNFVEAAYGIFFASEMLGLGAAVTGGLLMYGSRGELEQIPGDVVPAADENEFILRPGMQLFESERGVVGAGLRLGGTWDLK
jgi:hypothetical protein